MNVADESACLTTRVGTIELEVPRDREGTFQTALFQHHQRRWRTCPSKALVLTLMQMVGSYQVRVQTSGLEEKES